MIYGSFTERLVSSLKNFFNHRCKLNESFCCINENSLEIVYGEDPDLSDDK